MTIPDRSAVLAQLHAKTFTRPPAPGPPAAGRPAMTMTTTVAQVIDRIRRGRNGPKLAALHDHGDMRAYADEDHPEGNPSSAEAAEIGLLGFYTRKDPDLTRQTMLQSALRRPKWDTRRGDIDYLDYTIARIFARPSTVYGGVKPQDHPTNPRQGSISSRSTRRQPPSPVELDVDPCADRVAALEARITELEQGIAERDAVIAEKDTKLAVRDAERDQLLSASAAAEDEARILWELYQSKGASADIQAAAGAFRALHRELQAGRTDTDGQVQLCRARLAEEAHVSEAMMARGMALNRALGNLYESPDPSDPSEYPRLRQRIATDFLTGLRRLRDVGRHRNQEYVERRGRTKQDHTAAPTGERAQETRIPPCASGAGHPIDAVCRIDGTVVAKNLAVKREKTASQSQLNKIRSVSTNGVGPKNYRPEALGILPPVAADGHGEGGWQRRSFERGRAEFLAELARVPELPDDDASELAPGEGSSITSREWVAAFGVSVDDGTREGST